MIRKGGGFNDPRPSYFAKGYQDYINGPMWKLYRAVYFSRHAKICRICRTPMNIQLHHLNHQDYMSTDDRNYVPLCKNHHAAITRGFKTRSDKTQNMRMYTLWYIALHTQKG